MTPQPQRPARVPEDARPGPSTAPHATGGLFDKPKDPPAPATTLAEAHPKLCKPFAQSLIELKPGALTQDKSRGLAMPFVDLRSYFTRLDRVVGPEHWSYTYQLASRGVVCALTIFGVTKSAIGDFPLSADDENPATSAEAQAFKRACAAFGLGRYLYSLPQVWGDYDKDKKRFIDPRRIVAQMYDALPQQEGD